MAKQILNGDSREMLPVIPVESIESEKPDDKIEYDDAAILAFHPDLRRKLSYDVKDDESQEAKKDAPVGENREAENDIAREVNDGNEQKYHGALTPEERAMEMLKGPHEKLAKMKEDIKSFREDVKHIKTGFEKMNKNIDQLENSNKVLKKLAKRVHDELDVVIHQNKVIKHLYQVAEEMELFQCYVTEDRHVIFVDQDEVVVEECGAHDGRGNNSCCTCKYKTKMEIYDDVD